MDAHVADLKPGTNTYNLIAEKDKLIETKNQHIASLRARIALQKNMMKHNDNIIEIKNKQLALIGVCLCFAACYALFLFDSQDSSSRIVNTTCQDLY